MDRAEHPAPPARGAGPADAGARLRWLALVALVAVAVVGVGLRTAWPTGPGRDASYLLAVLGAPLVATAALAAGWRVVDRLGWALVTAGLLCAVAGDVLLYAYSWRGEEPGLSWCDPLWMVSYALLATGVVRLYRVRRGWTVDVDEVIDTTATAVVTGYAAWALFIGPAMQNATVDLSTRLVSGAYPVLDAVLLVMVARAMVHGVRPGVASSRLLLAGVACWLVADYGAMIELQSDVARGDGWMDFGWMVAAVLMSGAVVAAPAVSARVPPVVLDQRLVRPRELSWTLAPLLVPVVVHAIGQRRGASAEPEQMVAVTAVLLLLASWRAMRLVQTRNDALARLGANERFYRTLAATSSDAVVVVDASGRLRHDAPTLPALLDQPGVDLVGRQAVALIQPVEEHHFHEVLARALASPGEVVRTDLERRAGTGPVRWLEVRAVNLLDDRVVNGVVVSLHDATERKATAEELSRQAFHDPLTGLANRALFRDRLDQALRRSARSGLRPAVLFMDLDGFKKVNDSLGHEVGDALLVTLGERIRSVVGQEDTVARLGGDEFAILLDGSTGVLAEATAAADRVIAALRAPVQLGDREIALSTSIGIDVGHSEVEASAVLRNADIAMYRAKATGKGRWVVFDPSMRAVALERLELEIDLARAVDEEQFRLVYQPFLDLQSGEVVGFEALVRWDHPTYGLMPPDSFIPIAEDTGLIARIGAWALHEACRVAAGWRRCHPDHERLFMSVNVSGVQVARADLVVQVASALEASGLTPHHLVLEITETALVSDPEAAAERLAELRDLGVRVAIDDFGTGYSSLAYLRQFAVDILKIDQSFVNGISEQAGLPALIRALLDLGRTLDLEVVAEGIELPEQFLRLREANCHLGQGYLFARPLPAEDAATLLLGGVEATGVASTGGAAQVPLVGPGPAGPAGVDLAGLAGLAGPAGRPVALAGSGSPVAPTDP